MGVGVWTFNTTLYGVFKYLNLITKLFGNILVACHCTQKFFFYATVFDSRGFPNLILFLVLHVSSKQNLCFSRYAYTVWTFWHFVDLHQFWVIFGGPLTSWENQEDQHCEKTYGSKTLGWLFRCQEVITKWLRCHRVFLISSKKTFLDALQCIYTVAFLNVAKILLSP